MSRIDIRRLFLLGQKRRRRMAEGGESEKPESMSTWNMVVSTGSLPKNGGTSKELATVVMARMRDDEAKLIRQMKKLIKKHKSLAAQILTTDIDGWMPLHASALRGSKKLLKVFLSSGVDINIPMGQPEGLPGNCSLLHMAALRGDINLLEYLISKGAFLDVKDSSHMTPVMYAAKRKHRRAVRTFEDNGANMEGVELFSINDYDPITPQPTNKFCFFG